MSQENISQYDWHIQKKMCYVNYAHIYFDVNGI